MNSNEKMMAVLDLFDAEHPEWSAEGLQARLGYSQSALYRHLKILTDFGLLSPLAGRGYSLGPRVIEFDYQIRRTDPMIAAARPEMEELGRDFPSVGLLCRKFRDRVLCVHQLSTTDAVQSSYERGLARPLLRGAASLVILAHLTPYQLARLHETMGPSFDAARLGDGIGAVRKRMSEIRKAGWIHTRGELTADVVGIAAPIFDAPSSVQGSLSLTLPDADADAERIARIGERIVVAARRISDALS